MFTRTISKTVVPSSRLLSTNPRVGMAQALLRLEAIGASKTAAELEAATKALSPSVNLASLPASLQELNTYLNPTTGASQEPFVPNPDAWQNLPFFSFVAREAKRPFNVWVFLLGPAVFLYLVSTPWRKGMQNDPESIKGSLYLQQLGGLKAMALPGGDHH